MNINKDSIKLVKSADVLLQEAQVKFKWNNYYEAETRINEAHQLLQQFIEQCETKADDMTQDDTYSSRRTSEPTSQKVVRHGQIDRQYNQQLDGVGNPNCPLYDKDIRITGTFDQIGMSRDDVAAACQRLGAKSAREGICKSMDVVIIGNNPGPTKQSKIEAWRNEGCNITTITQFDFKEILNKYNVEE